MLQYRFLPMAVILFGLLGLALSGCGELEMNGDAPEQQFMPESRITPLDDPPAAGVPESPSDPTTEQ